jgi:two-component system CheB/CheR fusion protein
MDNTQPNGPMGDRPYHLKRQLQESNERYALIAKATNDVIYDLDLVEGAVEWNDVLYAKYGYDQTEPANTLEWWAGHVHPDDAERIENEIGELLLNNHDTWQSQYRFLKADGEYAVVRDRAYVQRDHAGMPMRIIGSMLDITESERLDRAKDEFTSLVSHQLRTPLTIIQLYSAMLADGVLGRLKPDQLDHVQRINHASEQLISLVGNILNISRLELDRVHPRLEPTDIYGFIVSIVKELRPLARERHITITMCRNPGLPPLRIDRVLFGEVAKNILTNAIHYSPANRGKVRIAIAGAKDGYILSVQDNGIGIPASARSHIFSRFYRANNAIQTGADGTGLGLYLVKLIVEALGGTISFESIEGRGTTFFVQLPVAQTLA